MRGAPQLLSAGRLVEAGYRLSWGQRGCRLVTPGGRVLKLQVVDHIPILTHGGDGAVDVETRGAETRHAKLAMGLGRGARRR